MRIMPRKPYVRAEDITVAYGSEIVFSREDFLIEGPGLVLVIGPNGAGKTTLFKTILGLIRPIKGTVVINGLEVTGNPKLAGRLVGYVPQMLGLDSSFPISVREIVESAVILRQRVPRLATSPSTRRLVDKILHELGLEPIANKPFTKLSGGQRQKTLIARALVWNPEILVMDEPLSAVDVKGKYEIAKIISSLSLERLVLVSSHDPTFFLPHASMIMVVNKGIVAMGPPEDVMRLDILRKVYGKSIMLIEKCVHVVDSNVY